MSGQGSKTVDCPICSRSVLESLINQHIDNNCTEDTTAAHATRNKFSSSSGKAPSMSQASLTSLFASSSKNTSASSSSPIPVPTSSSVHRRRRSETEDTLSLSTSWPSKRSRPDPSTPARPPATSASRLQAAAPLADRLRPQSLGEYVGQPHLTGCGSLLMGLLEGGSAVSMIFWGPPGCGKTTLARLFAGQSDAIFKELSATDAGIADVRNVAEEAKRILALTGRRNNTVSRRGLSLQQGTTGSRYTYPDVLVVSTSA